MAQDSRRPWTEILDVRIESYWSNVELDFTRSDIWWVYVLDGGDENVEYVGFAKNFRRRLTEHLRFWRPAYYRRALVIAVWSEAEARRLENHLICVLDPEGNRTRPQLSWVEREHFGRLREKWYVDDLLVCPGCTTLCEKIDGEYVPVVEPDDDCEEHQGPARQRLARSISDALCSISGHDPHPKRRGFPVFPTELFEAFFAKQEQETSS